MGNRVGIYCRLSDEDRFKKDKSDDSESIANQKSMLLKYALNKNWEVINVYSDDDYSGADINRPKFNELLKDCENGEIDIVLCKTQSRFSRDMEVIEKYIHNKFIEWGVRFVSIVDNADTQVRGNKKARQINGLINEWYLEDLSDNIRSSLQNRRDDGLFLGSFAPYGYIKDPNNKNKLLIDPVASEVVKEIFELSKKGYGYHRIAGYLNDKGVLTPSNYKKQNGSRYQCRQAKNGVEHTKWTMDTICTILKNEVYIGNLVQGKKTYVSYKNHKCIKKPKEEWTYSYGTHEPIIDMETWNCIHKRFDERARVCRTTGEAYMLSRKTYCKECKRVFNRQLYKTKDGKTAYLKCKGRRIKKEECINDRSIRCDVLEQIILDELNKQLDKYYSLNKLERQYELQKRKLDKSTYTRIGSLRIEKQYLQSKIDRKNEHYKTLYEDKIEGIISSKEFMMFRKKFLKEIEDYKSRISIIEEELKKVEQIEDNVQNSEAIFKKYRHIDKLNKEIVDEFIDKVRIGKLDPDTNTRDIDIELNIIKLV